MNGNADAQLRFVLRIVLFSRRLECFVLKFSILVGRVIHNVIWIARLLHPLYIVGL